MAAITKLSQLDMNATYSYADYLLWQFKERVELYKGKINIMLPSSNTIHQVVLGNIFRIFFEFCKKNHYEMYRFPFENRILNIDSEIQPINTHTVVQPDLSIYSKSDNCDEFGVYGIPELIIEIPIENFSDRDYKFKFELYQEAGVKEYWIVNTSHKVIQVYTLMDNRFYGLQPQVNQDIIFSPIFPDLDFSVSDIFINVDELKLKIKENELERIYKN
jgi:Uma2 family endonuclease